MNQEVPSSDAASADDIRLAIEQLTLPDLLRLRKAARYCLPGSRYNDPDELLNEAVMRTMSAADGGKGRVWRKSVPLMAYLIKTMEGLANDSRESWEQGHIGHLEDMGADGMSSADIADRYGPAQADLPTQLSELEHDRDLQQRAQEDLAKIDDYFKDDIDVSWIIMGIKDGLSSAEIRSLASLTQTQYETARRRFRRGVEKLFPGRSQS